MIIQHQSHDIETATGTMRTSVYRPQADGKFPAIIFYSEIFQQTAPLADTSQLQEQGRNAPLRRA